MYISGLSKANCCSPICHQVLRQLDCHVVCFDYRGYADSTMVLPNETGVVSDAKAVYNWLTAEKTLNLPNRYFLLMCRPLTC